MDKVLKRLLIEGIGCILFGIIFLVSAIINKGSWYEYLLIVGLFLSGSVFIYKSITISKKMKLKNIKKTTK